MPRLYQHLKRKLNNSTVTILHVGYAKHTLPVSVLCNLHASKLGSRHEPFLVVFCYLSISSLRRPRTYAPYPLKKRTLRAVTLINGA